MQSVFFLEFKISGHEFFWIYFFIFFSDARFSWFSDARNCFDFLTITFEIRKISIFQTSACDLCFPNSRCPLCVQYTFEYHLMVWIGIHGVDWYSLRSIQANPPNEGLLAFSNAFFVVLNNGKTLEANRKRSRATSKVFQSAPCLKQGKMNICAFCCCIFPFSRHFPRNSSYSYQKASENFKNSSN